MPQIHLAVPPNIARALTHDLSNFFPEATFRPPMTHDEMDTFFSHRFGLPEETADLTLTAYPGALRRALSPEYRDLFAPMPETLPPMRPELADAGLFETDPLFRTVCVVPMMILAAKHLESHITGWGDLTAEELHGHVVIPPPNTPAPALFRLYMESLFGEEGRAAADAVNATQLPQDINRSIDEGTFLAGMAFPAFTRSSRNNATCAIWPKEGAVAIPLVALLRADAPREATGVLAALFSQPVQTRLAEEGLFLPIRKDVPLIREMADNNNRLAWCGWKQHISVTNPQQGERL